jgi:hypothetical protein
MTSWALETSGRFSVSSLYRKINKGPNLPHKKLIWKAKLPLKIKIFLWQMAKGKMPASALIKRRHNPSDGKCALCGLVKTVNHIFFSCVLANFAWSGIREGFGVQWSPTSVSDFLSILAQLDPSSRQDFWLLFAAQRWALWHIRNKFIVDSSRRSSPSSQLTVFLNLLCFYSSGAL